MGYAGSTIITFVSGISFYNRLHGFDCLTNNFLVKKVLHGLKLSQNSSRIRKPITLDLLHRLVAVVPILESNLYYRDLFHALMLLMFHGFFRIGEICLNSKSTFRNILQRNNVTFTFNDGKLSGMCIIMLNSKHHYNCNFHLNFKCLKVPFCPVFALYNYLEKHKVYGDNLPLFCHPDGSHLSRSFVTSHIYGYMKVCKLDKNFYQCHSFRIGAASHAYIHLGLSDSEIMKLGRWSSLSFKRYIRCD